MGYSIISPTNLCLSLSVCLSVCQTAKKRAASHVMRAVSRNRYISSFENAWHPVADVFVDLSRVVELYTGIHS